MPTNLLRFALLADAAASGATGLIAALGAGALAGLLGLPETPLRLAGLALLPFAALVLALGLRARPPRRAVLAVIAVNALWAAESVALPLAGWIAPGALGLAVVLAQALAVAGLAALQWLGLRRETASAAA